MFTQKKMIKDYLMKYYINEEDKKDRANRLTNFLIEFKRKLDNPNFRTNHNLNKWKYIKNTTNKTLSSLGYKLDLETEELRELIPMKIKVINPDKEALTKAMEYLEMARRKCKNAKDEMLKAKEDYKNKLNDYEKKRLKNA